MPPRKATGRKTDTSTSTIATIAPETSWTEASAASNGDSPFSSIRRSTFSRTTIASSTTMPMAITMAKSVRVLMPKPKSQRPANVPIRETGTAIIGINVARQLPRKRKTTRTTRMPASKSVCSTSRMEAATKRVVSKGMS